MKVWEKIICGISGVILIIFFMIIILRPHGIVRLHLEKKRLNAGLEQNKSISQKNEDLRREINRLKKDLAYIETIARQELGMIAEDEIVIVFPPQKGDALQK